VAQRLVCVARSIGRANLLASTDCGFNTFVGRSVVPPAIAWLKLAALVERARLASQQLW
jgi:5-methyltetrahydropteroyltriglutamate--homocysteine methyltransferase